MMYNVTLDIDERELTLDRADDLLDALAGYHAAVSTRGGRVAVTISLLAETLEQAVAIAIAVTERATGRRVIAVEAMTSDEFDRRAGLEPLPELMSVAEIAEEWDITRQAVLGLIERGRFATARRVGKAWAVSRHEVFVGKPRTAEEIAAAIARGARRRGA